MKTNSYDISFTWIGLLFIIIGILFILTPHLIRYIPEIQKVPPLLLYIYHRDNFWFATSPLLIIISVLSIIFYLIRLRIP
jgi:hypothetical protein